jgi:hypothetical protein
MFLQQLPRACRGLFSAPRGFEPHMRRFSVSTDCAIDWVPTKSLAQSINGSFAFSLLVFLFFPCVTHQRATPRVRICIELCLTVDFSCSRRTHAFLETCFLETFQMFSTCWLFRNVGYFQEPVPVQEPLFHPCVRAWHYRVEGGESREDSELYANGNEFGKSSKQIVFLQRFTLSTVSFP